MTDHLHLAPEVAEALRAQRPVVALESTLITHGLPHPANVETALAMEAAIRESGAIPATIAILEENGASAGLLKILKAAVGASEGVEVSWTRA